MSRTQLVNSASSTLSGGINAVVTSLTVASATSFPSSPQFVIIVGTELMLVTAVSGAVFTVTRGYEGSTAASHSNGAAVTAIMTKGMVQQFHRDYGNPLADVAGTIPQQLLDGNTTLTGTDLTNINFTNATKADVSGGSVLLTHATQGATTDIAIVKRTAPSAPHTFTVGFVPNLINESSDFPSCGLVVRENSSGELYYSQFATRDEGNYVLVTKHASPTTSATNFINSRTWSGGFGVVWMQVEDDNTDLIFRISADGLNFLELGREARTTFLTPDEIGFGIQNFGNANIESMATLVAWSEE